LKERALWNDYQDAYEEMIRHTATDYAPWYVVPADHKWFTRIVVASATIDGLASLDLEYPSVTASQKRAIAQAKATLGGPKES
jgi:hypothetical protein